MATEAEIPESISTMKREGEIIHSASEFDSTVHNTSPRELKNLHDGVLNMPPEIFEHSRETKNIQAANDVGAEATSTVNKIKVEVPEGEIFLESLSAVQVGIEDTCRVLKNSEPKEVTLQAGNETLEDGKQKQNNEEVAGETETEEKEKPEKNDMSNDIVNLTETSFQMAKIEETNLMIEEESLMEEGIIDHVEVMGDQHALVEDKSNEKEANDIQKQDKDEHIDMETNKQVLNVHEAAEGQNKEALTHMAEPTGISLKNIETVTEPCHEAESAVEAKFIGEEIEETKSIEVDYKEAEKFIINEVTEGTKPSERTANANVSLDELNEKIEYAEVEVPNRNANDLHVIHSLAEEAGDESKIVNKVLNLEPQDIIQEASGSHTEVEKYTEDAPEACQSANSTILEHASIEGARTTDLTPKAIEMDIEKPQEASVLDYEEKSAAKDNGENTDQEVQKNGEACDAVAQEILAKSPDAGIFATDAEASIEVNSAEFEKEEKVEQIIQVGSPQEAAPELTGQYENIPDAEKCVIDAEASVEVSSAEVVKDKKVEQNIQVESPDESCKAEENDKRDKITNEEVHDGTKITGSVVAINELVIEANVEHNSLNRIGRQNVESSEGDENMEEKSEGENNSEQVTEDNNIRCLVPESVEQAPVKDEKKKSEESTGEILENANTIEATDNTAHEAIKDIESPKENLDGCVGKKGETSPEEKRNEQISTFMYLEKVAETPDASKSQESRMMVEDETNREEFEELYEDSNNSGMNGETEKYNMNEEYGTKSISQVAIGEETLQKSKEEETLKIEACEESEISSVTKAAEKQTLESENKVHHSREFEGEKIELNTQEDDTATKMSTQGNDTDISPLSIEQEPLENSEGSKNKVEKSEEENNREHNIEDSNCRDLTPEPVEESPVNNLELDKWKAEKSTVEIFESSETSGAADITAHETSTAVESTTDILDASLVKQGDSSQNEEKHLTATESLTQEIENNDGGLVMMAEDNSNGNGLLDAMDNIKNKPSIGREDLQHTAQENEPEEKHEQSSFVIPDETEAVSSAAEKIPGVTELHEDFMKVGKCDTKKHIAFEECSTTDISLEAIEERAPQSFEEEGKEDETLKTEIELEMTNVCEDAEKQNAEKEKTIEQSRELEIQRVEHGSKEDDMAAKTSEQEECEITKIDNEDEDIGKQDQEKGGAAENFEVSARGEDEESSLVKENEQTEHDKQAFEAAASSSSIETEQKVQHTKQCLVSSLVEKETLKEISKEDESKLVKSKEKVDESNSYIEKTEATSSTEETVFEILKEREESNVNSSPLDITREREPQTPPKETDGCQIEESAAVSLMSNKEIEDEIKEEEETTVNDSDSAPITVVTEENALQEAEPEDERPVDIFASAFEEKDVAEIGTEKTMLDSEDFNVKAEGTSNMENKRDDEFPTVVDKAKEINRGQIEDSAVVSHPSNKEAEEIKEEIIINDSDSTSVTEVTEEKGLREVEPADKKQVENFPPAFEEKDIVEESEDINVKPEYVTDLGEKKDNETPTVGEKARETNEGLIIGSAMMLHMSNNAEEEIKRNEETTITDSDSVTVVTREKALREIEAEDIKQVDNFATASKEEDKTNKTILESFEANVKPEEALNLGERDNEIPIIADKTSETNGGLMEESVVVSYTSSKETEREIKAKEETAVNDSNFASMTVATEEKGLQEVEPEEKEQVDSFATAIEEDIVETETKGTTLNMDIQVKPENTPYYTETKDQIEVNTNNLESSNLELQMGRTKDENLVDEALETFETSGVCTESEKAIPEQEISEGNLKEVLEVKNTEIEQKREAHSQRHEDTNNKHIGFLPGEKFEYASEIVAENQTNEALPKSGKSQIEESSIGNQNQEDDKEIKEEVEPQLKAEVHEEQNANDTAKEQEQVEQSGASEDIKELIIEDEHGMKGLHPSSNMENSAPVCSEYNEAADLTQKKKIENSEIEEDSVRETETSLARELEEKAQDISTEPNVKESQEKIAEIVEESQDDYSKIDDAALTAKTDGSSGETELNDKLVKNLHIEETETENSQQGKEGHSMKLEETSELATKIASEAESESGTTEKRDVCEPDETKIASEAVFESQGQGVEEAEVGKNQTVEKANQVPANNNDHVGRENAAAEPSGVTETRIEQHEDTNNKDNGILTEKKLECASEIVAENQTNEARPECVKSQMEESSRYNHNQETNKEIEEKRELQLEAAEYKGQNTNETTTAVIFTEKEQEGVEQSDNSENLKELVVEEEGGINELHSSSTMENSATVCSEYNEAVELKEKTKTENSKIEEDSAREREASLARESEEERAHDISIEPDIKESQEQTVEFVEETQENYKKIDDATLTTKTGTNSREAELGDKLLKDLQAEATETENSQQGKEVDGMKLEEKSELATKLPLSDNGHAESESITIESREVGEPEETKIASEAVFEPKGEGAEEATVEKPDQVPTNNDDHAGREIVAMENSVADEVEEARIVSKAVDETKDQGSGDTAENGESSTVEKEDQILTSDSVHAPKESVAAENAKADEINGIKVVADAINESKDEGTEESDGKSSTVEKLDQVPATNPEHEEIERAIVEKLDAEEVEETKIVSDAAYKSKDQNSEEIEKEKNQSEENPDAVIENQIAADQTPSADAQLPIPISTLPSKHENETKAKKKEEEKPQEEESLEDKNLAKERVSVENPDEKEAEEPKIASNVAYKSKDQDTEGIDETGQTLIEEKPDAAKIEEASKAASDSRAQGVEPVTENETTAGQTPSAEKVNAQLPTPASTLPFNPAIAAKVEKTEEQRPQMEKLENEVLEDSSAAKPTEEICLQTKRPKEPEISTLGFKINKDIQGSPTEVYEEEGQTADGALELEPRENDDKENNAESSTESNANIDLKEQTGKSCDLEFETSEKALQSESVVESHEDPSESEDADIKKNHPIEMISDVSPEENQCKNTSEANEITENEVSKEEIREEKEVAKICPPISPVEETINKCLQEDGLRAEECTGEETNNASKSAVHGIQFEELSVTTEKANTSTEIREQVAAEDRSVEDSDQVPAENKTVKESFPRELERKDVEENNFKSGKAEATTPRDKESSMDLSQKDSDKPGELIQETQKLKESSYAATEKQILTQADLVQRPDTVVQTGNELVPPGRQEGITEAQQKAEAGDVKPGNDEGVCSEAEVSHGEEKSTGCSGEETTEESALMDSAKLSSSDLLQRSGKETSEVARHVSKETEQTASKDQTEKPEAIQVKEAKMHEEKEEEEGDEHNTDSTSDAPVMVEASKDLDVKAPHKKSHNILSGVGSKVKHSISKVKKAITGKSSHSKPLPPK